MTDWEKRFDERFGMYNPQNKPDDWDNYKDVATWNGADYKNFKQFIKGLLKEEREKGYKKAIERVSKNMASKGYITYEELKKLREEK